MRKKLDNWWTYHKGIVILGIFIIALVIYVIYSMNNQEKKEILMVELINNVQEDEVTSAMEQEILKIIGGDAEKEAVFVDASLTLDVPAMDSVSAADSNTEDSMAKITTYVYAHELDLMIAEEEVINHYQGLKAFSNLEEFLPEDIYDAIKERVYYVDGVACGVRLEGTKFAERNDIHIENPVICIISGSEHKENAVKWLDAIFSE